MDLLIRIEAGTARTEIALLNDLITESLRAGWIDVGMAQRCQVVSVEVDHGNIPREALLAIPLLLIPPESGWLAQHLGHPPGAIVFVPGFKEIGGLGETPALAMAAAVVRARRLTEEGESPSSTDAPS